MINTLIVLDHELVQGRLPELRLVPSRHELVAYGLAREPLLLSIGVGYERSTGAIVEQGVSRSVSRVRVDILNLEQCVGVSNLGLG